MAKIDSSVPSLSNFEASRCKEVTVAPCLSSKAFIIAGTTTRPGVMLSFSWISLKGDIWLRMDGVKADGQLLSRILKVLKFGKADTAATKCLASKNVGVVIARACSLGRLYRKSRFSLGTKKASLCKFRHVLAMLSMICETSSAFITNDLKVKDLLMCNVRNPGSIENAS